MIPIMKPLIKESGEATTVLADHNPSLYSPNENRQPK